MKTARVLGISAVAATLVLGGCSTAEPPRVQETSTTTTSVTCPSGTVLSKIGKCVDAAPTTTSPSAAPNANPTAALPSVSACDGDNCNLGASDDEVDRLVSESIVDVANMWKNLNVNPNLHLYKNGAADCPHGRDVSATAWTCVSTHTGGWNPALLRSWAVERGATLSDTIRATIAHEVAHVVLDGWNSAGDDLMTKEVRADCLAAGYSRWTMTTSDSAMGQLPLERMKNVLYGSKSAKAMDAGYTGTPKTCASWTP